MNLNSINISKVLFWSGLLLLVISVFPSIYFPPSFGYENGPVEMVQNLLLLLAFIACLLFAKQSHTQERGIWIFASSMFFIAFWRELSWGAVIPALFDSSINPNHVSSRDLWYRPIITPLVAAIALVGIASLILCKSWQLIRPLIRAKAIALREIILIVVAALVGAATEEKLGLSLSLEHDASRTMEELAELCAYMFLIAAAFRTKAGLDRHAPSAAK